MTPSHILDHEFEKQNFSNERLPARVYDNCTFRDCVFKNVDLSNIEFLECTFDRCDFSMASVKYTIFNTVAFTHCKLLGVHFSDCTPFLLSFTFTDCILNLASFYQLKIPHTIFKNCQLQETDFTQTTLTNALFDGSTLENVIFDQTILEKADFRLAKSYTIRPENNKLKKAKFSKEGIAGLLQHYDISIQ